MDSLTKLYAARAIVFGIFAAACIIRAARNHLEYHAARKALYVLGGLLGTLATIDAYRVYARSAFSDSARAVMAYETPQFYALVILSTVLAAALYIVLQKRKV